LTSRRVAAGEKAERQQGFGRVAHAIWGDKKSLAPMLKAGLALGPGTPA